MTTDSASRPRVLVIIPARGGSKGLPGKNLLTVGGFPLIVRAVRSSRECARVDAVVVSTDDRAIAESARSAGADIVDRPAELAGDTATSESALLHAVDAIGIEPDVVVLLQATSPFIDPVDLDAAIERVLTGDWDVVFSARRTHVFLWREGVDGAAGVNHDSSVRLRRQDSEPQFQETGAFYVMRTAGLREHGHRFFGRVGIQVVPDRAAIEIDSEADLELARALAPILLREPVAQSAIHDEPHTTTDRVLTVPHRSIPPQEESW